MDHRTSRILMFASLLLTLAFFGLSTLLLAEPEADIALPPYSNGGISIIYETQTVDENGQPVTVYLDEDGNEVDAPLDPALLATETNPAATVCTALAFACLIGGQVQYFLFCRCPHCGHGLWRVRGLDIPYCPDCGEKL